MPRGNKPNKRKANRACDEQQLEATQGFCEGQQELGCLPTGPKPGHVSTAAARASPRRKAQSESKDSVGAGCSCCEALGQRAEGKERGRSKPAEEPEPESSARSAEAKQLATRGARSRREGTLAPGLEAAEAGWKVTGSRAGHGDPEACVGTPAEGRDPEG